MKREKGREKEWEKWLKSNFREIYFYTCENVYEHAMFEKKRVNVRFRVENGMKKLFIRFSHAERYVHIIGMKYNSQRV